MAPNTAYVGMVCIFRDNKDTLPKLLASVANAFEDFSFVDTGASDGSREIVEAFLADKQGRITDFEWCDDFAAARNQSLENSRARWRMFLDTDDELLNGGKLRPFLIDLEARAPQVEACFVDYEYDALERFQTMRLVRYRPGWRFVDAIHERLEFDRVLPEQAYLRTGPQHFSVLHKPKTPEEKRAAIARNAKIARGVVTDDAKYDARLKRTIAMELKSLGRVDEVIPLLEPVYNEYRNYPEGRQAAADIFKAYLIKAVKDVKEEKNIRREYFEPALEWAKKAGPAYETLAHHARGEWDDVLRAVTRSSGRGQQTTHEGYVFEQGSSYVAAAQALLRLAEPFAASKAERLLERIPLDILTSPELLPALNEVRDVIDRITIVVPGTPQPFDENGGGGMLGGSEEAVMYLVRALARAGRNVRVFGVLPPHRLPGHDRDGVDWQPFSDFDVSGEHGTLVLWRSAQLALALAEQKSKGKPMPGIHRTFLWLHDSGFGLPPEHVEVASRVVNGSVVLSDFHAKQVVKNGVAGGLIKLANGVWEGDFEPFIDLESFALYDERQGEGFARDPNRVVYSSCPSRGLVPLLEMWPAVKAECPDAYLDIYYDWSMLEMMQPALYERCMRAYDAVKHLDVVHHGGVSHETLHEALRGANVWAYSHFESVEVETSCVSLMKALSCGATVLTVPNGALPETAAGDACMCLSPVTYRLKLISLLKNPEAVEVRREKARRAIARFGWERAVGPRFSEVWSRKTALIAAGSDTTR